MDNGGCVITNKRSDGATSPNKTSTISVFKKNLLSLSDEEKDGRQLPLKISKVLENEKFCAA